MPALRPRQEGGDDEARIRANVEKMRNLGAPDHEIETYLTQVEGRQPVTPRKPLISRPPAIRSESTSSDRQMPRDAFSNDVPGFIRTAEQGATFGFGDEINAGVRSMMGADLADALASERGSVAQFRERHPAVALGAELAGGLAGGGVIGAGVKALRGGAAVAQATGAGRLLRNVATGAAAGAATGAGMAEGGMEERARGAGSGALWGAGFAGGASALGGAAKAVAKPIVANQAAKGSKVAKALTRAGLPTAEDLAKEDIAAKILASNKTLDDVEREALTAHPDAMLMDVGGSQVLRRARGVYATPSRGSDDVERALRSRVDAQPKRVGAGVSTAIAPRENAVRTAKQLMAERRTNSAPWYERAHALPDIEDPDLVNAIVKNKHFREMYDAGRELAAIEGVKIPPLLEDLTIKTPGVIEKAKAQNAISVRGVDYMKRGLDDMIERGFAGGTMSRTKAKLLKNALKPLLEQADELAVDPKTGEQVFKKARSIYHGDSELMEAYELGRNFRNTSKDELEELWGELSDTQKQLYIRGSASDILTDMAKVSDGRDVTQRFANEEMRDKLAVIQRDPASMEKLQTLIAQERKLHENARGILHTSKTSLIDAERGDPVQGAGEMIGALAQGQPLRAAPGFLRRALTAEYRGLNEETANALAPMLTAKGDELAKVFAELRQHGGQVGRSQQRQGIAVRQGSRLAASYMERKPR